jgi:uncharacterized protein YjbJ (UPF0337 family)
MNKDVFQGKWTQLKGAAKTQWGKLTDDDLTQVEGNQEKLIGRLQERYGYAKDQAEKEVNKFLDSYKDLEAAKH